MYLPPSMTVTAGGGERGEKEGRRLPISYARARGQIHDDRISTEREREREKERERKREIE